ncbi:unnamed protein product [Calicophoron daubneyi]|uniref:Uncharacterized protein n=1 Tax=Calicophoron daubneyi TaxID=300641 RepID=A0AAV2T4H9_CALDB
MPRIVEYIISNGMNAEGELFRVKKDWVVRFVPDVSLVGLNIRFFINYPGPGSDTFDRSAYRELQFINPTISKKEVDCFDNYFELSSLSVSGSFRFYFSTDGSAPAPPSDGILNNSIAGSGYITVDPHFRGKFGGSGSPDDERDWDLDGVVLQSYVSKYLGPFDEWESRLATAFEGKYNMIHFTPMQNHVGAPFTGTTNFTHLQAGSSVVSLWLNPALARPAREFGYRKEV